VYCIFFSFKYWNTQSSPEFPFFSSVSGMFSELKLRFIQDQLVLLHEISSGPGSTRLHLHLLSFGFTHAACTGGDVLRVEFCPSAVATWTTWDSCHPWPMGLGEEWGPKSEEENEEARMKSIPLPVWFFCLFVCLFISSSQSEI